MSQYQLIRVSLFLVLDKNLFLRFDWYHFVIYLNSLYEPYLPLSILYLILFFNCPIRSNFSSLPLHTEIAPAVSYSKTSSFFCITPLIRLRNYIVSVHLFILSIVCSNTISIGFVNTIKKKVIFVFGAKPDPTIQLTFYITKGVVWVILTINICLILFYVFYILSYTNSLLFHCIHTSSRTLW